MRKKHTPFLIVYGRETPDKFRILTRRGDMAGAMGNAGGVRQWISTLPLEVKTPEFGMIRT